MQSLNFEFLRKYHPVLAELGTYAEGYFLSDKESALMKLRLFGETLTAEYYYQRKIPKIAHASQAELLEYLYSQKIVQQVVLDKLHLLRKTGNLAAHGQIHKVSEKMLLDALKSAFELAQWFCLVVYADPNVAQMKFILPEESVNRRLQREKKQIISVLHKERSRAEEERKQAENRISELLQELEKTRSQAIEQKKSNEELLELMNQSHQAVSLLKFNEAETRKLLIDQMLVLAGWDVEDKNAVRQEFQLTDQPTQTGTGFADYVLWDTETDKPLAVIEVKKTSKSSINGHYQAKLYADALEKQTGTRPIIFYSNGCETYVFNDAANEIPRRIYGFYSRKSLRQRLWRNGNLDLKHSIPDKNIVDRYYQYEAIRRVDELFKNFRRKALIVLATGTGKTRVAIALTELLLRQNRIRRVLFLCDRKELQKQAFNAFKQHIPAENGIIVKKETVEDRDSGFYFATYPAMSEIFRNYDVGFFDLVIADEAHRSIYNKYRELFLYFDAHYVGLTATPKASIAHNTYEFFECRDEEGGYAPTAWYSFEQGVADHFLCPFQAIQYTTQISRQGMKYSEMSEEQREQLEMQLETPEELEVDASQLEKEVFNRGTERLIIRNLMEKGIREQTGQHIGKSIVFARNHRHALFLKETFEEMYPQYMHNSEPFCAVIDTQTERHEILLEDFKNPKSNLTLAISVDMLDTGVDVPEIVNLVFAKPVKSFVKFWQMIGRGTRLCPNLFGPGMHKEHFLIFDHWGNFEYFGENPEQGEPAPTKSLLQRIFESRISLAEEALACQKKDAFESAVILIHEMTRMLPSDSIAVQEHLRDVMMARELQRLLNFDSQTLFILRNSIAPLMQWCPIGDQTAAYRLDWLMARMETAFLRGSSDFANLRGELENDVADLAINIAQVKAKSTWISKVNSAQFWKSASFQDLEDLRGNLRSIMQFRKGKNLTPAEPRILDVTDRDIQVKDVTSAIRSADIPGWRNRVESLLQKLLDEDPVLAKIKNHEEITPEELQALCQKVILHDPTLDLNGLLEIFPHAKTMENAIRQIIGTNHAHINQVLTDFFTDHPWLTSHQLTFLGLIRKAFLENGYLEPAALYEAPFINLHSEGLDGLFPDPIHYQSVLRMVQELNQQNTRP